MKKKTKKLVLAKETMRRLEDLVTVRGGAVSDVSGCQSCDPWDPCQAELTKD